MNLDFKLCNINQLETLIEFSKSCFSTSFSHLNSKQTMDSYMDSAFKYDTIKNELSNPNSLFYFLYADDELAGYFKLNVNEAQTDFCEEFGLEVQRIYVAKKFQSLGLGAQILSFAVEKASKLDKAYVWLGVWEKNFRGIAFYEKNGFIKSGMHSFFMGDEQQFDFVMKKEL
ncbi:MAG: GNAT family N-acetyltransferase [Clostridia bacterium]